MARRDVVHFGSNSVCTQSSSIKQYARRIPASLDLRKISNLISKPDSNFLGLMTRNAVISLRGQPGEYKHYLKMEDEASGAEELGDAVLTLPDGKTTIKLPYLKVSVNCKLTS